MSEAENRREVASRKNPFFHRLASSLVGMGLTPNQISVASAVFGVLAGVCLASSGCAGTLFWKTVLIVLVLLGVQLRLICNLIDGLMAVEGGMKTPAGELFNDVPDRVSDVAILVGMGYGAQLASWHAVEWGWFAAVLAVLTAYVRTLGAAMGAPHFFIGPMAKQHRMFIVNIACLFSLIEAWFLSTWGHIYVATLIVISAGALVTCVRRLGAVAGFMRGRAGGA